MSFSRRKSALMSTILGMESSDALKEDAPIAVDEMDEQIPEELNEDDLSFLDETPGEIDGEDEEDVELNVEDIVGCADSDGKVKMSSIRALAECCPPDDLADDDILSATDDDVEEFTASLNNPGIEDTIGNQTSGGDPSLSQIVQMDDDLQMDEDEQKEEIKKITARIDRLANYCERSGHKRLAYRLDVISDKLEQL